MKWMIRCLLVFVVLVFSFYRFSVIIVISGESVLLCEIVEKGDTFSIDSLHSVSLTPLREEYLINKQLKLINYESLFTDQGGAGMPDVLSEDESFSTQKGHFLIKRNRMINMPLYVLINDQWSFNFKNQRLDKLKVKEVEIRIEQVSIAKILYYNLMVRIYEI